ncbi:MAG TPA: TolC family protein [Bryobacteraceae bacterium]|nr:TolC family protein [Bryobacteraceae bacterium]
MIGAPFRKFLAVTLSASCLGPLSWGQQGLAPQMTGSIFLRDYSAPMVPPVRLGNGARLRSLVQGGKLYLTAQDAIALALENNLDIESNRYNALLAQNSLRRAQAGGTLAGVPSPSSQVNAVTSGQGVAGSQQAAGINISAANGSNGSSNTTIRQIGSVTPALDPVFQDIQTYSHLSQPQSNLTLSGITNLIDNKRNYNESISTGFLTGGNATLTYTDAYLGENAPTNTLNPINTVSVGLTVRQNFLFGFGVAVNSRNINIQKIAVRVNDLTFQTQVISVVVNVLNYYYALVADYQDVKAKGEALKVAQQFYADNKKQVELGAMAPLDVTTAEAQAATSEQELVAAETTLEQQQVQLKNALSRNGLADPLLENVEVIPLDKIDVPENDNLPTSKELIATAMANRVELASDKLNYQAAEISALGTKNGLLPTLTGQVSAQNQGLAGTGRTVQFPGVSGIVPGTTLPPGFIPCPPALGGSGRVCSVPPDQLLGNIGTALGQVLRRDFPTQSAAASFSPTLKNRQAQADDAIDRFQMRQTSLQNQRTINQVAVDASNEAIALQQARAKYQSATKNRVLQEQLLQAEQRKFSLGASTSFLVVQQQRDLATAQSSEVASLVAYSNARVSLDQILGLTLKNNHISLAEAQNGAVNKPSALPAVLPSHP